MELIMNEFKYVQDLLNKATYNNEDLGDKPSATLNLLARYYREIGKTDDEIKNLLDNFLKSCLKDSYKPSKWIDSIFYQVKKSGKYSLKKVDEVTVTKSEIDTIQNVKGKARQKVLFTLLILAKFYNAVSDTNNNWCNMEYKKIFKLANVQLSTDNQALLMNDLYSLGLIKYSKNISKLNVSVNFIDNDSDIILSITQLRDLGKEYLMFCGEGYIRCEKCGVPIKKSRNGRTKYCFKCGVCVDREKAKDRMNSLRNK